MTAVALSQEQEQLVAMVTRLVDGVATGSPRAGEAVPFAADAWHAVVDAGLVGIGIGEEAGGCGAPMSGGVDLIEPPDRYFHGPNIPLFALHGNADPMAPYQPDVDNFARVKPPKFFMTFLGGGHIEPYFGGDDASAIALQRSTADFWDRYLKGDEAALARLHTDASVVGKTTLQEDAGGS